MNLQDATADGIDVTLALHMTLKENQDAIDGMKRQAYAKAQAKREFAVQKARETLRLRTDGKVPAAVIKDAIFDVPQVADAYFDSELQECLWDACKEEVMLRKREADVLREELARMHSEAGGRSWQ